jgi:molybdopterin molybdotransferase
MTITGLTTVSAHRADVIAAARPLHARLTELGEADGAVLAEDVSADWPLPLSDNSAMDGYAVSAADTIAAAPATAVTLAIDGEIAAGDVGIPHLAPGTCVKIMTGAILPRGADAVVRREWVKAGRREASFTRPARPGESVRRAGSEARPGDLLLTAGTLLGPAQLGLLAAAGQRAVLARPSPRIAILSGGNELIPLGAPALPAQSWESNSLMLASAARGLGCAVRRYPIIGDDRELALAAIHDASRDADLLVTTGGIGRGWEHDVFKAALRGHAAVRFRPVAMRPGMPQGLGSVGDPPVPILLLPGNPVSAYVSFRLFAEPAVRALQGLRQPVLPTASAVLAAPVTSAAGKISFISAIHDQARGTVTPAGRSVHQLTSLAQANALIIVAADGAALPAGEPVEILRLER